MKELIQIQNKLNVPKNRFNAFGKYKYRSCEDIVEAVKPFCYELGCTLTLSDDVIEVGGRVYVRASAQLLKGEEKITVYGWAREALTKKKMDEAQITGSASSYARKYALNGLFAIDDTKDADDTHGEDNALETDDLNFN